MEAVVMKQLSIVFIVWWLSVMSGNALGHVLPNNSDVQLKSDGNTVELYKSSGNGSSWLQMVLVFSRHSSNSQPQLLIEDAPRNSSAEVTTESPKVTTMSTKTPTVCKEGFVLLESKKCYFFSNKTETWQVALKSCQAMGTTLFYPLNANENTVMVNYVKKTYPGVNSWWLGASDDAKEGQFIWAHSKSPIGYADWLSNQPDNAGNAEDCVRIYKDYGWRWNDVRCHYSYNYICQPF